MVTEQRLATFEPVIARDSVYYIERRLESDGDVLVRQGDRVEPGSEVASAMIAAGRPLMLNIARELGMEPDAVTRYLTRPVGSTFEEGEAIARARRGLRSVSCPAPVTSTLSTLDQATGVATLVPQTHPQHLYATVYGEVESLLGSQGAMIRAAGSRILGSVGLGRDTHGTLKVGVDRADRELTADMIDSSFRDCIVLGGMTLGTSALRRLADVGARGVIVGSISDSETRRFFGSDGEFASLLMWRQSSRQFEPSNGGGAHPLSVMVTEGFGRRRMAQPVFQFLAENENQVASIVVPPGTDVLTTRPALYLTGERLSGTDTIQRVHIEDGAVARLTDPERLGIVVTCRSEVFEDPNRSGVAREVVDVEYSNGTRALVPALNLEVLFS